MRTSSPSKGTRSLVSCSAVTRCAMTASPGCPCTAGRSAAPLTDRSLNWVSEEREKERIYVAMVTCETMHFLS